jgi:quercetin dioxygenase-like cupin family protein
VGFINLDEMEAISPLPGLRMKTPFGERIMLSYLEMDDGAEVPLHAHPHEQAGMLLKGKLQLTIGDETRVVEPGEMYLVPGGVPHRAVATEGPVVVLDIFSPIREDYAEKTNHFVPQPDEPAK